MGLLLGEDTGTSIGFTIRILVTNFLPRKAAFVPFWAAPITMTPMYYLLKTEPSEYSFADLQKDGTTSWDGVTNPVAVRNLREMPKGSELIIYHTGDEKRAVGTASLVSVDPADPKKPIVTIKAGKQLSSPKSLAEIKANKMFQDSPLVTVGRLSVVPLTKAQYEWLVK
jgi:predicted RNA-binding protein with PUA-like domain